MTQPIYANIRDQRPSKTVEALSLFQVMLGEELLLERLTTYLTRIDTSFPYDPLLALIKEVASEASTDQQIYQIISQQLKTITPIFLPWTFARPALRRQTKELHRQVLEALTDQINFTGAMEIGSQGRLLRRLQSSTLPSGDAFLVDTNPDSAKLREFTGKKAFVRLDRFAPINDQVVARSSLDLILCTIGLHHAPAERLLAFLDSLHRILRPGGRLVIREYDATSNDQAFFITFIHTIANLLKGLSWQQNLDEVRNFHGLAHWIPLISSLGFDDRGLRLTQAKDPTANTMVVFSKIG